MDVCWRELRDEPKTVVDEDCVTNQKNVCCYTSTYTVSSFSHNSRNSRLMFVLTPALSWFTRKTQQKKSEALSQASAETQATHSWVAGFVLGASVFIFPDCMYRSSNIQWERKARGKAWMRLPVFNLPLCHWSSRFLDLRALLTLSSRCFYHICP